MASQLTIIVLILAGVSAAFPPLSLAVEQSYTIPGPSPASAGPAGLVNNIYFSALLISGVLAFGAIVYGGIKYTVAAGNPSGQSEGKEWVKGALLGLLLLGGAHLILRTINPELVSLKIPGLTGTAQTYATQPTQAIASSGCNVATFGGTTFTGGLTPGGGGDIQFLCVSAPNCQGLSCAPGATCTNYALPGCQQKF